MARRIDNASDVFAYYVYKEPLIIPVKIPHLSNIDVYKQFCLGIWDTENHTKNQNKEKERYNMERNKVLDLYVKKNREKIETSYREKVEKEYNELPEVKEYNDLVNTFEASLEELAHRCNDNTGLKTKVFTQTGYFNHLAWEIDPSLKDDIKHKYQKGFEIDMCELDDFANEVQAVLSISEDKDYQIEVLKNYDILDKKGKLNI